MSLFFSSVIDPSTKSCLEVFISWVFDIVLTSSRTGNTRAAAASRCHCHRVCVDLLLGLFGLGEGWQKWFPRSTSEDHLKLKKWLTRDRFHTCQMIIYGDITLCFFLLLSPSAHTHTNTHTAPTNTVFVSVGNSNMSYLQADFRYTLKTGVDLSHVSSPALHSHHSAWEKNFCFLNPSVSLVLCDRFALKV